MDTFKQERTSLVEPETKQEFAAHPEYEGKRYAVLGVGSRKMHLLHVYAADFAVEETSGMVAISGYFEGPGALHRETRGKDLERALEHDERLFRMLILALFDKAAELVFHHHVKAERMREELADGLRRAMELGSQERIEKVTSLIIRDLNKGDRILLRTRGNQTLVVGLDGSHEVFDEPVARAIWSIFLGQESVVPSLKASIARTLAEMRTRAEATSSTAPESTSAP